MKKITVVSLGPGGREYLTLGALDAMRGAETLILRTARLDAARYLEEQGIPFTSLDALYDESEDFDELTRNAVGAVLEAAKKKNVVYAVFDAESDETVRALLLRAPASLVAGVPLSAPLLCAANWQGGARVCAASSLEKADGEEPLLVTELDSPLLAGQVKLALLPLYGEEQEILFFPPAKKDAERPFLRLPLRDLDRQKHYDHTAAALIIPRELTRKERFSFGDLVKIMEILRGENGCPWDRAQTHASLRPYLIEEAYETTAAIDDEDYAHAADELGDVLLQVVFQGNIGVQYGTFDLSDITTAICRKMIARHPHLFGSVRTDTPDQLSWEELKRKERGFETQTDALMDVSRALPPLMRAEKVQKRAAQVRFDFDGPRQALLKVHEEADEVLAELDKSADPAMELGDLFFACVNVARLCDVESETALMQATEKFVRRFECMENMIKQDGKSMKDLTTAEMDVYWIRSKHRL